MLLNALALNKFQAKDRHRLLEKWTQLNLEDLSLQKQGK